jgi:hypothetical protein
MNVGGLFYNLIKDMYKISAVCVKVGQNLTDSFESSIGVRQGDVLRGRESLVNPIWNGLINL